MQDGGRVFGHAHCHAYCKGSVESSVGTILRVGLIYIVSSLVLRWLFMVNNNYNIIGDEIFKCQYMYNINDPALCMN